MIAELKWAQGCRDDKEEQVDGDAGCPASGRRLRGHGGQGKDGDGAESCYIEQAKLMHEQASLGIEVKLTAE